MELLARAVKAIPSGRYVVAISGGVDSMALLGAIRHRADVEIVVAHANHGVRADAGRDAALVVAFCKSHNISYITKELHLGSNTSEAEAREARYSFLRSCLTEYNADAIITAHHQDDLLETAIINILRGTGWRGVAPFIADTNVLRPLLNVPKAALLHYAQRHAVPWREDSTNAQQHYLRNYIRLTLIPYLSVQNPTWRDNLLQQVRKQLLLRRTIEDELNTLITSHIRKEGKNTYSRRYMWCMLPRTEGYELFQALCRRTTGHSLIRELAEAALLFAKTARAGKKMPLTDSWQLRVTQRELIVEPRLSVVK